MPEYSEIILPLLAVFNLIAFAVMAVDKSHAKKGRWRVPERTLLLIAFFGGSIGIYAGMYLLRHKTRKPKFFISVPLMILAQAALIYFILQR